MYVKIILVVWLHEYSVVSLTNPMRYSILSRIIPFWLPFFTLVCIVGCNKNAKETKTFDFGNTLAMANYEMTFTSKAENGNNLRWDFGDGTSSQDFLPKHTYATAGEYVVKLWANNAEAFLAKVVPVRVSFDSSLISGLILHKYWTGTERIHLWPVTSGRGVDTTYDIVDTFTITSSGNYSFNIKGDLYKLTAIDDFNQTLKFVNSIVYRGTKGGNARYSWKYFYYDYAKDIVYFTSLVPSGDMPSFDPYGTARDLSSR